MAPHTPVSTVMDMNCNNFEEIMDKVISIIESARCVEGLDVTDGAPASDRKNLLNTINALKEKVIKIQNYHCDTNALKIDNVTPNVTLKPDSGILGLSFDFLLSNIGENFKDKDTSDQIEIFRNHSTFFSSWMAFESKILEPCSFLNACERLLSDYDGNDDNTKASTPFEDRKTEIKTTIENWKSSSTAKNTVDGALVTWKQHIATANAVQQESFYISCKNDAVLDQLIKFCEKMAHVVNNTFPENAP